MEAKSKDRGSTPTMTVDWSFSVMERPTIPGSAPKRRSQRLWLRVAAFRPFHLHSSSTKPRPIRGCTPS